MLNLSNGQTSRHRAVCRHPASSAFPCAGIGGRADAPVGPAAPAGVEGFKPQKVRPQKTGFQEAPTDGMKFDGTIGTERAGRPGSSASRPDAEVQNAEVQNAVAQNAVARLIARIAARHFSVRISDVCTKNRGRAPVALARQAAIYIAHVVLRMTYAGAGAAFGRDRTTAAHACRCIEDRRDDAAFDRLMARIERECAAALAIESQARGPDMSTMMADAVGGVRA